MTSFEVWDVQLAKIVLQRYYLGGPGVYDCIKGPKYEPVVDTDTAINRGNVNATVMGAAEGFGIRRQSQSLPGMALTVTLQGAIFRQCRKGTSLQNVLWSTDINEDM